jgi:hypothetical protein
MSFFATPSDTALERAQTRLATAQGHLQRVEEKDDYCCDLNRKDAIKRAKAEVKRWSQWLEDRGVLESEQKTLPGM